jgi:hypothetical protein
MNYAELQGAFIKALEPLTRIMVAPTGTIVISDTSAHTGLELKSFIAQGATLSVCTGLDSDEAAVDFLAAPYTYGSPPDGVPIIVPTGYRITAITLSAGSLAGYNV